MQLNAGGDKGAPPECGFIASSASYCPQASKDRANLRVNPIDHTPTAQDPCLTSILENPLLVTSQGPLYNLSSRSHTTHTLYSHQQLTAPNQHVTPLPNQQLTPPINNYTHSLTNNSSHLPFNDYTSITEPNEKRKRGGNTHQRLKIKGLHNPSLLSAVNSSYESTNTTDGSYNYPHSPTTTTHSPTTRINPQPDITPHSPKTIPSHQHLTAPNQHPSPLLNQPVFLPTNNYTHSPTKNYPHPPNNNYTQPAKNCLYSPSHSPGPPQQLPPPTNRFGYCSQGHKDGANLRVNPVDQTPTAQDPCLTNILDNPLIVTSQGPLYNLSARYHTTHTLYNHQQLTAPNQHFTPLPNQQLPPPINNHTHSLTNNYSHPPFNDYTPPTNKFSHSPVHTPGTHRQMPPPTNSFGYRSQAPKDTTIIRVNPMD